VADRQSWINLSGTQQDELHTCVPTPGWRLVPGSELPSLFPDTFRTKIGSAVVIAAPTSTGGAYLVFSANRVDVKAGALDIEPFGVILHSTGPGPSGAFIHHGTWADRTQDPPEAFWAEVSQSDIAQYFGRVRPRVEGLGRSPSPQRPRWRLRGNCPRTPRTRGSAQHMSAESAASSPTTRSAT